MCFSGYPTHYAFQYFFYAEKTSQQVNTNEIRLAKDYQTDMELAESIFRQLVSSNFPTVNESENG